jgi:hypothetical protein
MIAGIPSGLNRNVHPDLNVMITCIKYREKGEYIKWVR